MPCARRSPCTASAYHDTVPSRRLADRPFDALIVPVTNVIGNWHVTVTLRGGDGKQTGAEQIAVTVLQIVRLDPPWGGAHGSLLCRRGSVVHARQQDRHPVQ